MKYLIGFIFLFLISISNIADSAAGVPLGEIDASEISDEDCRVVLNKGKLLSNRTTKSFKTRLIILFDDHIYHIIMDFYMPEGSYVCEFRRAF